MGLTDYQVQFLGMIDKKAMSWVVRAADFQNFYVVKLVVLKPGPLPTIGADSIRGGERKSGFAGGYDRAGGRAGRYAVPGSPGCA